MKVETYLSQGKLLDQRINYSLKKLAELRNAISDIHSPVISKNRVQTSPSGDAPFVRALMRVEEMETQINREIDMLIDLRKEIHDVINQVEDKQLRAVLECKYLEGKRTTEIARQFHVCRDTIYRWMHEALSQITLPEEPIVTRSYH